MNDESACCVFTAQLVKKDVKSLGCNINRSCFSDLQYRKKLLSRSSNKISRRHKMHIVLQSILSILRPLNVVSLY